MEILIWVGAVISLLGLFGLFYCIHLATKAKKEGLEGEAMKERLQQLVALNMAALGVSGLGLMMVTAGVFLA